MCNEICKRPCHTQFIFFHFIFGVLVSVGFLFSTMVAMVVRLRDDMGHERYTHFSMSSFMDCNVTCEVQNIHTFDNHHWMFYIAIE